MSVLAVILMSIGISVPLSILLFIGYVRFFAWSLYYAETTPRARVRQALSDIKDTFGDAEADMDDVIRGSRTNRKRQRAREEYGIGAEWSEWR